MYIYLYNEDATGRASGRQGTDRFVFLAASGKDNSLNGNCKHRRHEDNYDAREHILRDTIAIARSYSGVQGCGV